MPKKSQIQQQSQSAGSQTQPLTDSDLLTKCVYTYNELSSHQFFALGVNNNMYSLFMVQSAKMLEYMDNQLLYVYYVTCSLAHFTIKKVLNLNLNLKVYFAYSYVSRAVSGFVLHTPQFTATLFSGIRSTNLNVNTDPSH